MQKQGKQRQIDGIELLQMSICRDEERKLRYTEVKTCKCQYRERKQNQSQIYGTE